MFCHFYNSLHVSTLSETISTIMCRLCSYVIKRGVDIYFQTEDFKIILISNFRFTIKLAKNTSVTSELQYMFHTSENLGRGCKFEPFVLLAGFRRDQCGLCCCQLPIVCVICCAVGQPPNRILSQRNTARTVVRYWRKAREIREALIRTLLLTSGISLYLFFPKQFSCFLDCNHFVVPIGCAFFVKLLRRFFMWGFKYLGCL